MPLFKRGSVAGKLLRVFGDTDGEQTKKTAEAGMLRLGNILEARAVELAPVDTGELESSSNVRVQVRGNVIGVEVTFNAPHSAAAHELDEEQRGPRTLRKPGNNFGQPGPKYLERPLVGFRKILTKDIAKALQTLWRNPGQRAR